MSSPNFLYKFNKAIVQKYNFF